MGSGKGDAEKVPYWEKTVGEGAWRDTSIGGLADDAG